MSYDKKTPSGLMPVAYLTFLSPSVSATSTQHECANLNDECLCHPKISNNYALNAEWTENHGGPVAILR